jgi:hypothetical protein
MAETFDGSRGENSANNPDDSVVSERVQELTWALLDEQINDDEFLLLDNLLLSDEKARGSYVGCVQLHTDLLLHFAAATASPTAKSGSGAQILGFLNAEVPLGFQSPTEEAAS